MTSSFLDDEDDAHSPRPSTGDVYDDDEREVGDEESELVETGAREEGSSGGSGGSGSWQDVPKQP